MVSIIIHRYSQHRLPMVRSERRSPIGLAGEDATEVAVLDQDALAVVRELNLDPVARVAWVAFADEPPGTGLSEVGLGSEVPAFPFFLPTQA